MFKSFKKLFSMLWKYKKVYFLIFFLITLLQIAGNITGVLLPRYLVDFLMQDKINKAAVVVGIICLASLFIGTASMIAQYRKSCILADFNLKLNTELVKCAHSVYYQKYEDFKIREKYQFAVKCAKEGSAGKILEYILNVFSSILSLVCLFYLISYVVWWLWLVIVASIVINTICESYRIRYNFESNRQQNAVEMRMLYARDRLTWKSFAKEVRLFHMFDYVVKTAEHYIDALSAIHKERASKTFRALFWSYLFNGVQMIAVYGYVGYKCLSGSFSVGEFTMLTLAILSISQITGNIAANFMEVKQQGKYLSNYFSFISDADDQPDACNTEPTKDFTITFENVRFTYPGSENEALSDVSYTFHAGKKYGIVGANGSGKTTFIHLLMGLYESTSGQVRFNMTPVQKLQREQYYSLFSPVLQDFNIYAYTVRENIAMAADGDDEKLKSLIDKINLTERIERLPRKADTYVTTEYENAGTEFSGGEQQKIAIMRAFYKDAPIMVMDEPTSALSPKSEYELYTRINELAVQKTVFFISHRMASCRMCDEILVFDNGKIAESGTHEALMQKQGLYHRMFSAQASLYAEESYEKN